MRGTQRFYDSTSFWVLLGVLSMSLHGAIALFWLQKVISLNIAEPTFVPIELVTLPETSASAITLPQSSVPETQTETTDQVPAIASPATPVPETSPQPSSPSPTPSPTRQQPSNSPAPASTPAPSSSPSPAPSPSPTPTPATPTPTPISPSPQPVPTPNPVPASPAPTPQPTPLSPIPAPPAPVPTPTPQPTPSPASAAPSPTPNPIPSSLNVSFGKFELSDQNRDIPDQPAKPLRTQQQLEAIAYLNSPDLSLSETITIDVVFTINQQGQSEQIIQAISTSTSITKSQAESLASEILSRWQFDPTYMAGKPVYQSYRAQLRIEPIF
ncbi:hypothetical protein Lepto7376_3882 [[Leptolyngbya] sp. PCC 7376]|nr:hypothetical protein Lepto7376_3882 [[Leptolyngbya] sp. PCC 7376]